MSIIKTRSFLERSGCGWITSIIIGVVFLLGIVMMGQRGNGGRDDQGAIRVAVEIGDLKVTSAAIARFTEIEGKRAGMDISQLPPRYRAEVMAQVLDQVVSAGRSLAAANKLGVDVTDDQIKKSIEEEVAASLSSLFAQLQQAGQIKATQKFDDFKKGPGAQRYQDDLRAKFEELRADPGGAELLRARYATTALRDSAAKRFDPSDDDVKKSLDSFVLQSIYIMGVSGKPEDAKKKADQVAAEIKAEGFDKVVDRYSSKNTVMSAGVSASKTPMPMSRSMLMSQPELAPVLALKPGEVTAPLTTPFGTTIYKLIQVKSDVPKDYDKQKAELRSRYIETLASAEFGKILKEQETATKVTWNDKGYKALYDWRKADRTFEALVAVSAAAGKASEDGVNASLQTALLAEYSAFDDAWSMATPKQKKDLQKRRTEVLTNILGILEDATIRLELVDLFTDLKDGAQAIESLEMAAGSNQTFDAAGQRTYNEINARLKKLQVAKLITDKQAERIVKEQQRWVKDKEQDARDQAEWDKKAAEDAKAIEAENKKNEAEQKARDAAKKKDAAAQKDAAPKGK